MGQRANLLIVEEGQYQLFYSHWCANTLTRDLFWGPEHAVKFIRMQREVDESSWLDEVWAEGAAVVDLDNQVLLLFGGEDVPYDVPLRRVYLDCLRRVWKAWDVRWAHEGIASIADYVGYPRSKVLTQSKDKAVCSLAPPEERSWIDIVASIQWASDRVRFYPLAGDPEAYLSCGPSLLHSPEAEDGLERLPLGEWVEGFPTGGFHIELSSQTVEFWTARDAPDVLSPMTQYWPDWVVRWHKDAFEFQADRSKGLLQFPAHSRVSLEKQLSKLVEAGRSGADTVREVAALNPTEAKTVEINPWALRDDRLELPVDVRRRILSRRYRQLARDCKRPIGCRDPAPQRKGSAAGWRPPYDRHRRHIVGPLGAGKTHLVRAVAEGLGANPAAVSSPTFVLIQEYLGRLQLYHFDASVCPIRMRSATLESRSTFTATVCVWWNGPIR